MEQKLIFSYVYLFMVTNVLSMATPLINVKDTIYSHFQTDPA